jgi:hypothetical protein
MPVARCEVPQGEGALTLGHVPRLRVDPPALVRASLVAGVGDVQAAIASDDVGQGQRESQRGIS